MKLEQFKVTTTETVVKSYIVEAYDEEHAKSLITEETVDLDKAKVYDFEELDVNAISIAELELKKKA